MSDRGASLPEYTLAAIRAGVEAAPPLDDLAMAACRQIFAMPLDDEDDDA